MTLRERINVIRKLEAEEKSAREQYEDRYSYSADMAVQGIIDRYEEEYPGILLSAATEEEDRAWATAWKTYKEEEANE